MQDTNYKIQPQNCGTAMMGDGTRISNLFANGSEVRIGTGSGLGQNNMHINMKYPIK